MRLKKADNGLKQHLIASVPCLHLLHSEIPRGFFFLLDAIELFFMLNL